ncbi:MAG: TIGR01212 family radical SAM protein [Candidatus Auribacter fodinae]|jgi:radical SAM protein (TIGR01212 family)|uniref:TIGR01212 family radical SAM protein n=1 Tax=Candidatus Auribacter fodinae TaxID=2093366 RepID=A0A3A4QRM5_9BACT|nr:MAG: TIGR01212 family radical SAM protein [Candidatus Auribacter fodinae]
MFGDVRYNNFNSYLQKKFGCRVYKISLDAGLGCPNRELGTPCVYCDAQGSGTGASLEQASIEDQMTKWMRSYRKYYSAEKFIAYFQAYTNTHATVSELKQLYIRALHFDDVVGLAIGTRPDCVDHEKIDMISSFAGDYEVWVEYGMQTSHDKTLSLIQRGHTYADLKKAVAMTKGSGVKICVHVIIGLPGESYDDIMQTAHEVAQLGIDGVKIHLLHVIKGSQLEQWYLNGDIRLLDKETYVHFVCDFLEVLPPNILIQRLTGERHQDMLTAPKWCLQKAVVIRDIQRELKRRNSRQGLRWKDKNSGL